ncbi:MAG: hypothetical protein ABFC57_03680 [Veillonellales bacterium]
MAYQIRQLRRDCGFSIRKGKPFSANLNWTIKGLNINTTKYLKALM